MEPSVTSARHTRARRLYLVVSILAITLVAVAALIVPRFVHTAHAAAPANTCMQIPSGADPTTFTQHQLKQYGLPSWLPGQSQDMWANMVRHARYRACTPTRTRPAHARPRSPSPTSVTPASGQVMNSECNGCWSGYEAVNATYNFTDIWGFWQVACPPDNASLNEQGFENSTWIGIGGDTIFDPVNALQFVQLGTDMTYETIYGQPGYNPIPSATGQAWYEFFDQPHLGTTGETDMFPVACADWIMAEIDVPDAVMWLEDFRTGGYFSQNFAVTDTNMAECIVEQPSGFNPETGQPINGLLDFGSQTFANCVAYEATSGLSAGLNQFNYKAWTATVPITFPGITLYAPKTSVGPFFDTEGGFTVNWLTS